MARNERIISMVKDGMSYDAVAKQLGCTRSTVAGVCFRSGVKTDRAKAKGRGQQAKIGNSYAKVLRSDCLDRAVAMRRSGLSWMKIAKALGYSSHDAVARGVRRRESRA